MSDAAIYDIKTGRPLQPHEIASDIVALCAAFDELNVSMYALIDGTPEGDEKERAVDAILAKQEPMVWRLAALRATTMEEHRVRARTLWKWHGFDQQDEYAKSCAWDERLTGAILRDLAAEAT